MRPETEIQLVRWLSRFFRSVRLFIYSVVAVLAGIGYQGVVDEPNKAVFIALVTALLHALEPRRDKES